jgi:hypothetical protein
MYRKATDPDKKLKMSVATCRVAKTNPNAVEIKGMTNLEILAG